MITSPIFSLKYSTFNPNILAACDENGYITLIDTLSEPTNKNTNSNFNNTLSHSKIHPFAKYCVHDNTIFDFEWCFTDKKIITASGDVKCVLINMDRGEFYNEYNFVGHWKSVKNVKQAFFNENVFISCGRDGIIYLWDLRSKKNITNNLNKISLSNFFYF